VGQSPANQDSAIVAKCPATMIATIRRRPLTVFAIKGIPGNQRERIEAAVAAGARTHHRAAWSVNRRLPTSLGAQWVRRVVQRRYQVAQVEAQPVGIPNDHAINRKRSNGKKMNSLWNNSHGRTKYRFSGTSSFGIG
jgi:hypothetical protein